MHHAHCLLFALPALPLLFSCAADDVAAQAPQGDRDLTAGYAWYTQYCAGCHGAAMNSGSGGSLVDAEWKYGSEREDIFRSIHDGIPNMGMPAYGETLTDGQIMLIVDVIESGIVPAGASTPTPRGTDTIETLDYVVNVEEWAEGFATPWGLAFLDNETAIVTEKPGAVRIIRNGVPGGPVSGTPEVNPGGQGGMLAVTPHPDYAENGWIYLAYSHKLPSDPQLAMTRVVRGRVQDNTWTDQEVIWQAEPSAYTGTRYHYGVRIVFDEDNRLYFAIGDRGQQNRAQDLADPAGKVIRLDDDGSIPSDNPFVNTDGALPEIWSWGHRNAQGLAFHPITGDLWEAEHGPRGGDELNIARAGENYGWPEITYGINYSGTVITRERVRPGMEQPVWYWRPSIAVCAIDFYEGTEFPFWRNHLLISSLANQTVRLAKIQEGRVIHEEIIVRDRGRVRDVVSGPDGAVYVVLNDPGTILRLTAREENLR